MVHFSPDFLYQKIHLEKGSFLSIKNYAEITTLIDEKAISKEASYTAQQRSRIKKFPKICRREYFLVDSQKKSFYKKKSEYKFQTFYATFWKFLFSISLLGCVRGFF